MANITQDTVLMTQLLPAQSLDPAGDFFVVRDAAENPMIFSTGNDGILYLTAKDPTGHGQLVDLCAKFGLTGPSKVQALQVTQDQDLTIYVALTLGKALNESVLYLTRPFKPNDIDWFGDGSLSHMLMHGDTSPIAIQSILMVT